MHKVPIDYTSIFIGQLTDEMSIRDRFGKYGMIQVQVLAKQKIVGRRVSGRGVTRFTFVNFDGRDSATRAVKTEVPPSPTFPITTLFSLLGLILFWEWC
jgi:hypothetical protein